MKSPSRVVPPSALAPGPAEAAHAPAGQGLYQDPLMTRAAPAGGSPVGAVRSTQAAPRLVCSGDGGRAPGGRAAGKGAGDGPSEGEWAQDLRPSWRGLLQPLLLAFSALGMATVMSLGPVGLPDAAEARYLLRECGNNILMAACCFGLADCIAQGMQHGGALRELVLSRTCKVVGLGVVMNGVVYTIWMHKLNKLIPISANLDIESWHSLGLLLAKSLLDDLMFGVVANSTGIFARRLLDGDSIAQAGSFWHSRILRVTLCDFQFWPLWGMINFALVPHPFNVMFSTVGSLLWQIYMSVVSNWDKFARTTSGSIPHAQSSWDSGAGGSGSWKQVVHVGGYQNV